MAKTKSLLEDDTANESAPLRTPRTPGVVYLFIVLIGSANLLFGYENSAISGAKDLFAAQYGISKTSGEYSFLASGMPVGATAGTLIAGFLQDGLGRRYTLIVAGVAYIASVMISYFADGFAMMAAGRVLTGTVIGVFSSTAPMFIGELSPASIRGSLLTVNQVAICVGILLGYVSDKVFSDNWRAIFIAGVPVAGALVLAFIFITPFSPRWLMTKGREEEARNVLMRIRGNDEEAVEAELAGIAASLQQIKTVNRQTVLRQPHVLWAIAIGVILSFLQQFSGVNAVNAYAQDIFADAGFDTSDSFMQAIGIGLAKLGFVLVALALMDRVGRKPLLLVGCAGMTICLAVLGGTFVAVAEPFPAAVGKVASGSLILYMAFFEISLGPILWLLISELYPLQVKGVAMSIASTTTWAFTWCITLSFPAMKASMSIGGAFLFFAAICAAAFIFIYLYVFETKGKTLEQIEEELKAGFGKGHKSSASRQEDDELA